MSTRAAHPSPVPETTTDLIRAAGDASLPRRERDRAFREVVSRFYGPILQAARRITGDPDLAEDAAQETFLIAWQSLHALRDPAAFPAWILRIAANEAKRLLRARAVERTDPEPGSDGRAAGADPGLESLALRREMAQALQRLTPAERTAVQLYYFDELPQREIARLLDLPLTTVQKRLYTARRRLARALDGPELDRRMRNMPPKTRSPQAPDGDRMAAVTALFRAIADGDLESARALLAADSSLVSAQRRGRWGRLTPLHAAADEGSAEMVRLLLEHGAEVHARDESDDATPLHHAAGRGAVAVARVLLDHGADANDTGDMHAGGPLGWSLVFRESYPEMARLLLERGARMTIFCAIALDDAEAVRSLVARDPTVLGAAMSLCEDHQGPLHFAVEKERPAMLRLLLELGAEPNRLSPTGRSPLYAALLAGREEDAALLRAHGARTDVACAVHLGGADLLEPALAAGASTAEVGFGLIVAAGMEDLDAMRRLLAAGADPNARGPHDWMRDCTPLMAAAYRDRTEAARTLLDAGADVRLVDDYPGAAALHWACWNGNVPIIDLLLDAGADPALQDRQFRAEPISWAAENDQQGAIDRLLERGAALPLGRACQAGRLEEVRRRIEQDPRLVNQDDQGLPLHQAAHRGRADLVRLLLERGADPQLPNQYGRTALDLARTALEQHPEGHSGLEEVCRLLAS